MLTPLTCWNTPCTPQKQPPAKIAFSVPPAAFSSRAGGGITTASSAERAGLCHKTAAATAARPSAASAPRVKNGDRRAAFVFVPFMSDLLAVVSVYTKEAVGRFSLCRAAANGQCRRSPSSGRFAATFSPRGEESAGGADRSSPLGERSDCPELLFAIRLAIRVRGRARLTSLSGAIRRLHGVGRLHGIRRRRLHRIRCRLHRLRAHRVGLHGIGRLHRVRRWLHGVGRHRIGRLHRIGRVVGAGAGNEDRSRKREGQRRQREELGHGSYSLGYGARLRAR
ncbi:hypothetical protein MPL1032_310018 [Mesorhizobium plurifarium]|uniref:Uncharacterized protein n=1 Tax=Mesorhizobium plurifarium TaxID=69974 RepID=A0A0K2W4K0_MESPL|nr:hypothetical protein MPL1032_310018 [Mesorhizobium plurifarium]